MYLILNSKFLRAIHFTIAVLRNDFKIRHDYEIIRFHSKILIIYLFQYVRYGNCKYI